MYTYGLMVWESYKAEFEFDGSWRDIYVLETSMADWQLLVDFLHSGVYQYSYRVAGNPVTLALSAAEILSSDGEFKPLVSVNTGSLLLNCHFFCEDEIEFDFDPRDVSTEKQAEEVFAFMWHLGRVLNKEVVLTPENAPEAPIFKILPSTGEVQYLS